MTRIAVVVLAASFLLVPSSAGAGGAAVDLLPNLRTASSDIVDVGISFKG